MEVRYSDEAKADLKYWKKSGNKRIQKKISELIENIKIHPFEGIGKPELLKHNLSGLWSRRINREHRLIYEVGDTFVQVHSLVGHY
ncbi:MAG TPA: Txe/YoeB family addiction module toxin [Anseongella sp.]